MTITNNYEKSFFIELSDSLLKFCEVTKKFLYKHHKLLGYF